MATSPFDALIAGAGPAGCAAAITLARLGRRVALLNRAPSHAGWRIGETFGGEIRPLIERLGAAAEFASVPRLAFRAVRSAWGSAEAFERPTMLHPYGEGWHVDRAAFDDALKRVAGAAGVVLSPGDGTRPVRDAGSGWTAGGVVARYLIDASGRGGPALPGRRWIPNDRMIALAHRLPARAAGGELLIEAVETGWWYSAPQPDGGLVAAWMTDPELARAPAYERWRDALALAPHTSARVGSPPDDPPCAFRAETGRLEPSSSNEDRWVACGDAAWAGDPLSGDGVARALRSGVAAAEAVHRALDGGVLEMDAEPAYRTFLERQARFYAMETRWPESVFWSRRR